MSIAKDKVLLWSAAYSQAIQLESLLLPYCDRILIVGSLRRKRPVVHDIDIVVIPTAGPFTEVQLQAYLGSFWTWVRGGEKIVSGEWQEIPVDIYFATKETYSTLVLIRTGSAQHNILLAGLAKRKGWKLHAGGGGLTDEKGWRIAGDNEESFFKALGIPYVEPEAR